MKARMAVGVLRVLRLDAGVPVPLGEVRGALATPSAAPAVGAEIVDEELEQVAAVWQTRQSVVQTGVAQGGVAQLQLKVPGLQLILLRLQLGQQGIESTRKLWRLLQIVDFYQTVYAQLLNQVVNT